MELWLKDFTRITILFLILRNSFSHGNEEKCEVKSLDEPFPVSSVPANLRFMIFYWPYTSSDPPSLILNKDVLCLKWSNTQLTLNSCELRNAAQSWYQYQSSLINIKSGLSLEVNGKPG